ncbi:MAG: hypothetical protein GXY61_14330 [Lentisphaerae bacterium]|jgi:hypothetical protein|nr:hypothetical protein [Lentisphaerota bacterium]
MKHWMMGLILIGCTVVARAKEEYRTFSDTKERTITAKIVDCDLPKGKVTLELKEDKRRATIPIDSLSMEDQTYIKEWYTVNEALASKNLRITTKRKTLKKWETTETGDVLTIDNESYSGAMEETTEFEQIAFDITLQNTSKVLVPKMRMEYKIYYEQAETSTSSDDNEAEQLILEGRLDVAALKQAEKAELQTQYVQIREVEISFDSIFYVDTPPTGAQGDVHGMRARIYLAMPNGEEAMREFCEPSFLSEKEFPWEKPKEEEAE